MQVDVLQNAVARLRLDGLRLRAKDLTDTVRALPPLQVRPGVSPATLPSLVSAQACIFFLFRHILLSTFVYNVVFM